MFIAGRRRGITPTIRPIAGVGGPFRWMRSRDARYTHQAKKQEITRFWLDASHRRSGRRKSVTAGGTDMGLAASVIVPVHNGAAFVVAAVNSALSQTCRDIEIILVDDGSTDNTWHIINDCARHDSRILPIRRHQNGGPAAARNMALEVAGGRWIALLDADDAFLPDRILDLVESAEKLSADLLADNLLLRDFQTGAALGRTQWADEMPIFLTLSEILIRDMPDTPTYEQVGFAKPIIRREFLEETGIKYHEDILMGSDFLFYCECVARGGRFYIVPAAHYIFSVFRKGSITTRRELDRYHSVANHRIRNWAGDGDKGLKQVLIQRQRMIDFDWLRSSVAARDLLSALSAARAIPPLYLAQRLGSSALLRVRRRVGASRISRLGRIQRGDRSLPETRE